jgi:FMN-dependent NADH-azoreductase
LPRSLFALARPRGGVHAAPKPDLETSYVRQFLAFLGITDVEFVYAEGLAVSDASRQESLARAADSIARLTRVEPVAA